jgi:hypothetical protein
MIVELRHGPHHGQCTATGQMHGADQNQYEEARTVLASISNLESGTDLALSGIDP